MDSYSLEFKSSAENDFHNLPKEAISKIIQKIEVLTGDPGSVKAVKLSMSENLFRIRVGNYRIIYELDYPNKKVIIHYVRHRSKAYHDL